MKNKFFFILLLSFVGISYAVKAQKKDYARLTLANNTSIPYENQVVEIPWAEVIKAYPAIDTAFMVVVNPKTNKQIVYQLEKRGSSQVKNLLVQVSVPANKTLTLMIKRGKKDAFTAKTYARYVPERYDDFAWENDKIAFRMYGKAL